MFFKKKPIPQKYHFTFRVKSTFFMIPVSNIIRFYEIYDQFEQNNFLGKNIKDAESNQQNLNVVDLAKEMGMGKTKITPISFLIEVGTISEKGFIRKGIIIDSMIGFDLFSERDLLSHTPNQEYASHEFISRTVFFNGMIIQCIDVDKICNKN